jgi:hypothetical protein
MFNDFDKKVSIGMDWFSFSPPHEVVNSRDDDGL